MKVEDLRKGQYVQEWENGVIISYITNSPEGIVVFKIISHFSKSLTFTIARLEEMNIQEFNEFISSPIATKWDMVSTGEFVSFKEEMISSVKKVFQSVMNKFSIYDEELTKYIHPRVIEEWDDFVLEEFLLVITYPNISYFGFQFNARLLSKEELLAIQEASSKKGVWQALYPSLTPRTIRLLEEAMPLARLRNEESDNDLYDGSSTFSGVSLNLFKNNGNLSQFLQKIEIENFSVEMDFETKLYLHLPDSPAYEKLKSCLSAEEMLHILLPYFQNSQTKFEKALLKSMTRLVEESEDFLDECGMAEHFELAAEGGYSYFKSINETFRDTIRMIAQIKWLEDSEAVDPAQNDLIKVFHVGRYKTLYALHDAASLLLNRIKDKDTFFTYEEKDANFEQKIQEFEFYLPKSTGELIYIGDVMHHCVGSYDIQILSGNTRIVGVKRGDELKYCLEISEGEVVQAKKKFNAILRNTDSELLEAVKQYIEQVGLNINTEDLLILQS